MMTEGMLRQQHVNTLCILEQLERVHYMYMWDRAWMSHQQLHTGTCALRKRCHRHMKLRFCPLGLQSGGWTP